MGLSLSNGLLEYFWPRTHGAAYLLVYVVVSEILGAVIAAVFVASYASIARYRRRQPRLPAIRAAAGSQQANRSGDRQIGARQLFASVLVRTDQPYPLLINQTPPELRNQRPAW
jgi:hypothetical protein